MKASNLREQFFRDKVTIAAITSNNDFKNKLSGVQFQEYNSKRDKC